jgi:UDP-N-acetylmuramoylalanine--D-glutamate ligase
MDLQGKRALVMGLGIHGGGLGVARFLIEQGAHVTITDLRSPEQLQPSLDALAGLPIRYVLGEHRDEDFAQADLVVRNPGVPRESRYLQIAREAGAQIEMEMTLFFRYCQGPIIGITGTKGKTTTTLLTGAMLSEQFPDTIIAGNMRISAVEALSRITPNTPVVLELSSWQLEGLGEEHLSPAFALVTNLSPDHLNRYKDMADYGEAKQQIFLWQDAQGVVVLNADDAEVSSWAEQAPGKVVWFGLNLPGDGVRLTDDGLWWGDEQICSAADFQLPGQHNHINIAAAAALAKSFGVSNQNIRRAIQKFTHVPYRLEQIAEADGVRYINDTAATAPDAAIAALQSYREPKIIICGGADKNLPFDDMAQALTQYAKAIVLLQGTATPKIEQALAQIEHTVPIYGPFDQFDLAIAAAKDLSEPNDLVLLSPGCASFGMFNNEFHRGDEFRRIVNELLQGSAGIATS